MLLTSFFELFSIASLLPFISVLINPERVIDYKISRIIFSFLNINSEQEIVLFSAALFISAAVISSSIRIFNTWCNYRVVALFGNDISCKAYEKTLKQPYLIHINRNSSAIINTLVTEINDLVLGLNQVLNVTTNIFISISIVFVLFLISWKIAITSLSIFSLSYYLLSKLTKEKLLRTGRQISTSAREQLKSMQEAFGSIRDLILDNNFLYYTKIYSQKDYRKRIKFSEANFLGLFPRYLLEGFALSIFALIGLFLLNNSDKPDQILPLLGTTALGIQRLLPSMQQTYSGISAIRSYRKVMINILDYLNQDNAQNYSSIKYKALEFKDKIEIKDLSFKYKDDKRKIIRRANLSIKKGEFIGIVGPTGCGKSTFIDILMGLIKPNEGTITIDNKDIYDKKHSDYIKRWHSSFAHVPQNIYLSDSSIENNIVMNSNNSKINKTLLKKSCSQAEILTFINRNKYGFNTIIGERGILLSGGQLQRIGIARALYKQAKVLIFDEATSSLDYATENAVINSINMLSKDLTIVMIAHRLSTLDQCDKIIDIEKEMMNKI